jgi:hypothetical protein
MPNPKLQVVVEEPLQETMTARAKALGMTLSKYCAHILRAVHDPGLPKYKKLADLLPPEERDPATG